MTGFTYCECNSAIVFLKTKTGKDMPVDIDSISEEEKGKIIKGEIVSFEYGRHISHFATCPKANKFRRKK